MCSQSKQGLRTDFDRWTRLGRVIDRMLTSRRTGELRWRKTVERAHAFIAEKLLERFREGMFRDVPKPALPHEKRGQPFLDPLGEHVLVKGRNRGIELACESGSVPELTTSFVPRQQLQLMLANTV